MKSLSENQKKMLLRIFNGDEIRTCIDGLFWLHDPEKRVDGRTMKSLVNRGLASFTMTARSGLTAYGIWLTEQGKQIAEELEEIAYQERRTRRRW